MLYVKNKNGRAIECGVAGIYGDDIEITEAYYLDDCDEEVSEQDIEYIYTNYSDEIYEAWLEYNIGRADAYVDMFKDGTYE